MTGITQMETLKKALIACSLITLYGCASNPNIYEDTKDDTVNNAVLIVGGSDWSYVKSINPLVYEKNKNKFDEIYKKSTIPQTFMFNQVVDTPMYSSAWEFEPIDNGRPPVKLETLRDTLIIPPGTYKITTHCRTMTPPGGGYFSNHSLTQTFKANTYYALTCIYVGSGPIIKSSVEELK